MKCIGSRRFWNALLLVALSFTTAAPTMAQTSQRDTDNGVNSSLTELQSQVRELKEMVLQLQQQATESRAEISKLRVELHASHTENSVQALNNLSDESSPPHSSDPAQRLAQIEEDQQLLSGKINEQYQTKVESASKYRVRLSGIVLLNLFGNSGTVDNLDVPAWATGPGALDSSGAIGATLRQSIIGLEVFGPDVWGARTSGNINMDFGGGFAQTYDGVNSPLARLRTGVVRLDWQHTSLIAGQDQLFISPNSPTSYASLAVPPLAYAGNLWSWTPQIRAEHRFVLANDSTLTLQGGLLDGLVGEPPYDPYYRTPQAGERSRQPGYAARIAYSHPAFGQNFTLGAAGYYSRQNWGFDRKVNGWVGIVDWLLPLDRWFSLSGSLYRGAAIGGFGAALDRSVLYNGGLDQPTTLVTPINSIGGWAQLKFRLNPRLEFNAAFGQDNPFAADIRAFADNGHSYADPTITRNRAAFGNVIYRPRSDLLFALEYRRLRTFSIYDYSNEANQVNLSMGILF